MTFPASMMPTLGAVSLRAQAFGEPLAVLVGDALIVSSFQMLAQHIETAPGRISQLIAIIAGSVSAPKGIIAGQAWECEPTVPLAAYHAAKTGSLFAAATTAGAAAAGYKSAPWARLGELLGEAYQLQTIFATALRIPPRAENPAVAINTSVVRMRLRNSVLQGLSSGSNPY